MILKNKELNLENEYFKVVAFDEERYKESNRRRLYYLIQCKRCGKVFSRRKEAIINGSNIKCPNCIRTRFDATLNTLLYNVYIHYKNNAAQRNINFNLSEKDFKVLVKQNCYYCGQAPTKTKTASYKNEYEEINGIDRIDSSKEYSLDNCVPCCEMCNKMKNTYTQDMFFEKITQIYNHSIKGSTTIPQGSTLQANGNGNREYPKMDKDIV